MEIKNIKVMEHIADRGHSNCTSNTFTLGDKCVSWSDDDYGTWFDARAMCHNRGSLFCLYFLSLNVHYLYYQNGLKQLIYFHFQSLSLPYFHSTSFLNYKSSVAYCMLYFTLFWRPLSFDGQTFCKFNNDKV